MNINHDYNLIGELLELRKLDHLPVAINLAVGIQATRSYSISKNSDSVGYHIQETHLHPQPSPAYKQGRVG